MNQRHWIVEKKRFVLVLVHAIQQELTIDVGPKDILFELLSRAVGGDDRTPETRSARVDLPQAMTLETCILRPRPLTSSLFRVMLGSQQLPFAGDGGPIPRVLHHVSNRPLTLP